MPEVRRYAPGLARREELLDAARDLFAAEGFGGVSLRGIAAKAGISHASLLRYFASKDDLLLALLTRWEDANQDWYGEHADLPPSEAVPALARRNAEVTGYVELFAALTGDAASAGHPAHEHMRRRYEQLRTISHGEHAVDSALIAVWDGLQIMSLYLDGVDVPTELDAYYARPQGPGGDLAAAAPAAEAGMVVAVQDGPVAEESGYAPGRQRRAKILDSATELFAERGFSSTSLSDIASRVGSSKSTLLHHFGSKDALLTAVLTRRDERVNDRIREPLAPRAFLREVVEGARGDSARPGLIELYTVLSGEATALAHPAHGYFKRRFDWVIGHFASVFAMLQRSGQIGADRDPRREAAWFVALWDGLQVQWLYDPASVDIDAELKSHLERLLVP
ncbi:TetR/AcrR family transcriptional regulator [Glycomyces sp. NPDC047010]|uniref:TetR/AcrR family transcriptional regulator n=1 Tax=Glycomyces sp. NPDC047010 TaxID=3155023 RepID=UPI0033F809CE